MASDTQPPQTPVPTLDAAAIAQLIRDELDRANGYLEFAQGQIKNDRDFFKHLYTLAFAFIAIMVAAAGTFQYSSVSQMRTDMKASVDAELVRANRELSALVAEGKVAIAEARNKTTKELENVRAEVKERIDTEFQSGNISTLVANAAKDRTEKELTEIIRLEVSTQVAKGLKDEAPDIRKIIEDQTKEAVKVLEPTIRASVEKATQDQVRVAVEPIREQMATYGQFVTVETLATFARGDGRQALDYLLQIIAGNKPESKNRELVNLAVAAVSAVVKEHQSGLRMVKSFKEKQTSEAMKKFMSSNNAAEREAAIDNYPPNDKTILPLLVQIIKSDASLSVLNAAVIRFNALTDQTFDFWKADDILKWWDSNQSSFQ
jgi:hypothetical protein